MGTVTADERIERALQAMKAEIAELKSDIAKRIKARQYKTGPFDFSRDRVAHTRIDVLQSVIKAFEI